MRLFRELYGKEDIYNETVPRPDPEAIIAYPEVSLPTSFLAKRDGEILRYLFSLGKILQKMHFYITTHP